MGTRGGAGWRGRPGRLPRFRPCRSRGLRPPRPITGGPSLSHWWSAVERCAVEMPVGGARSKIDAVRGYGGEVILHDERATLFERLEAERERSGATFVHPFDDPVGLAGAGTVGLEILADVPDVDVI